MMSRSKWSRGCSMRCLPIGCLGQKNRGIQKTPGKAALIRYGLEDLSPVNSEKIVNDIKKHIREVQPYIRKTPRFVARIRKEIMYLHNYNCKVLNGSGVYPLTESMSNLLILYIELEMDILSLREYSSNQYVKSVQHKVTRLLSAIYSEYSRQPSLDSNPNNKWKLMALLFEDLDIKIHEAAEEIRRNIDTTSRFVWDFLKKPKQYIDFNEAISGSDSEEEDVCFGIFKNLSSSKNSSTPKKAEVLEEYSDISNSPCIDLDIDEEELDLCLKQEPDPGFYEKWVATIDITAENDETNPEFIGTKLATKDNQVDIHSDTGSTKRPQIEQEKPKTIVQSQNNGCSEKSKPKIYANQVIDLLDSDSDDETTPLPQTATPEIKQENQDVLQNDSVTDLPKKTKEIKEESDIKLETLDFVTDLENLLGTTDNNTEKNKSTIETTSIGNNTLQHGNTFSLLSDSSDSKEGVSKEAKKLIQEILLLSDDETVPEERRTPPLLNNFCTQEVEVQSDKIVNIVEIHNKTDASTDVTKPSDHSLNSQVESLQTDKDLNSKFAESSVQTTQHKATVANEAINSLSETQDEQYIEKNDQHILTDNFTTSTVTDSKVEIPQSTENSIRELSQPMEVVTEDALNIEIDTIVSSNKGSNTFQEDMESESHLILDTEPREEIMDVTENIVPIANEGLADVSCSNAEHSEFMEVTENVEISGTENKDQHYLNILNKENVMVVKGMCQKLVSTKFENQDSQNIQNNYSKTISDSKLLMLTPKEPSRADLLAIVAAAESNMSPKSCVQSYTKNPEIKRSVSKDILMLKPKEPSKDDLLAIAAAAESNLTDLTSKKETKNTPLLDDACRDDNSENDVLNTSSESIVFTDESDVGDTISKVKITKMNSKSSSKLKQTYYLAPTLRSFPEPIIVDGLEYSVVAIKETKKSINVNVVIPASDTQNIDLKSNINDSDSETEDAYHTTKKVCVVRKSQKSVLPKTGLKTIRSSVNNQRKNKNNNKTVRHKRKVESIVHQEHTKIKVQLAERAVPQPDCLKVSGESVLTDIDGLKGHENIEVITEGGDSENSILHQSYEDLENSMGSRILEFKVIDQESLPIKSSTLTPDTYQKVNFLGSCASVIPDTEVENAETQHEINKTDEFQDQEFISFYELEARGDISLETQSKTHHTINQEEIDKNGSLCDVSANQKTVVVDNQIVCDNTLLSDESVSENILKDIHDVSSNEMPVELKENVETIDSLQVKKISKESLCGEQSLQQPVCETDDKNNQFQNPDIKTTATYETATECNQLTSKSTETFEISVENLNFAQEAEVTNLNIDSLSETSNTLEVSNKIKENKRDQEYCEIFQQLNNENNVVNVDSCDQAKRGVEAKATNGSFLDDNNTYTIRYDTEGLFDNQSMITSEAHDVEVDVTLIGCDHLDKQHKLATHETDKSDTTPDCISAQQTSLAETSETNKHQIHANANSVEEHTILESSSKETVQMGTITNCIWDQQAHINESSETDNAQINNNAKRVQEKHNILEANQLNIMSEQKETNTDSIFDHQTHLGETSKPGGQQIIFIKHNFVSVNNVQQKEHITKNKTQLDNMTSQSETSTDCLFDQQNNLDEASKTDIDLVVCQIKGDDNASSLQEKNDISEHKNKATVKLDIISDQIETTDDCIIEQLIDAGSDNSVLEEHHITENNNEIIHQLDITTGQNKPHIILERQLLSDDLDDKTVEHQNNEDSSRTSRSNFRKNKNVSKGKTAPVTEKISLPTSSNIPQASVNETMEPKKRRSRKPKSPMKTVFQSETIFAGCLLNSKGASAVPSSLFGLTINEVKVEKPKKDAFMIANLLSSPKPIENSDINKLSEFAIAAINFAKEEYGDIVVSKRAKPSNPQSPKKSNQKLLCTKASLKSFSNKGACQNPLDYSIKTSSSNSDRQVVSTYPKNQYSEMKIQDPQKLDTVKPTKQISKSVTKPSSPKDKMSLKKSIAEDKKNDSDDEIPLSQRVKKTRYGLTNITTTNTKVKRAKGRPRKSEVLDRSEKPVYTLRERSKSGCGSEKLKSNEDNSRSQEHRSIKDKSPTKIKESPDTKTELLKFSAKEQKLKSIEDEKTYRKKLRSQSGSIDNIETELATQEDVQFPIKIDRENGSFKKERRTKSSIKPVSANPVVATELDNTRSDKASNAVLPSKNASSISPKLGFTPKEKYKLELKKAQQKAAGFDSSEGSPSETKSLLPQQKVVNPDLGFLMESKPLHSYPSTEVKAEVKTVITNMTLFSLPLKSDIQDLVSNTKATADLKKRNIDTTSAENQSVPKNKIIGNYSSSTSNFEQDVNELVNITKLENIRPKCTVTPTIQRLMKNLQADGKVVGLEFSKDTSINISEVSSVSDQKLAECPKETQEKDILCRLTTNMSEDTLPSDRTPKEYVKDLQKEQESNLTMPNISENTSPSNKDKYKQEESPIKVPVDTLHIDSKPTECAENVQEKEESRNLVEEVKNLTPDKDLLLTNAEDASHYLNVENKQAEKYDTHKNSATIEKGLNLNQNNETLLFSEKTVVINIDNEMLKVSKSANNENTARNLSEPTLENITTDTEGKEILFNSYEQNFKVEKSLHLEPVNVSVHKNEVIKDSQEDHIKLKKSETKVMKLDVQDNKHLNDDSAIKIVVSSDVSIKLDKEVLNDSENEPSNDSVDNDIKDVVSKLVISSCNDSSFYAQEDSLRLEDSTERYLLKNVEGGSIPSEIDKKKEPSTKNENINENTKNAVLAKYSNDLHALLTNKQYEEDTVLSSLDEILLPLKEKLIESSTSMLPKDCNNAFEEKTELLELKISSINSEKLEHRLVETTVDTTKELEIKSEKDVIKDGAKPGGQLPDKPKKYQKSPKPKSKSETDDVLKKKNTSNKSHRNDKKNLGNTNISLPVSLSLSKNFHSELDLGRTANTTNKNNIKKNSKTKEKYNKKEDKNSTQWHSKIIKGKGESFQLKEKENTLKESEPNKTNDTRNPNEHVTAPKNLAKKEIYETEKHLRSDDVPVVKKPLKSETSESKRKDEHTSKYKPETDKKVSTAKEKEDVFRRKDTSKIKSKDSLIDDTKNLKAESKLGKTSEKISKKCKTVLEKETKSSSFNYKSVKDKCSKDLNKLKDKSFKTDLTLIDGQKKIGNIKPLGERTSRKRVSSPDDNLPLSKLRRKSSSTESASPKIVEASDKQDKNKIAEKHISVVKCESKADKKSCTQELTQSKIEFSDKKSLTKTIEMDQSESNKQLLDTNILIDKSEPCIDDKILGKERAVHRSSKDIQKSANCFDLTQNLFIKLTPLSVETLTVTNTMPLNIKMPVTESNLKESESQSVLVSNLVHNEIDGKISSTKLNETEHSTLKNDQSIAIETKEESSKAFKLIDTVCTNNSDVFSDIAEQQSQTEETNKNNKYLMDTFEAAKGEILETHIHLGSQISVDSVEGLVTDCIVTLNQTENKECNKIVSRTLENIENNTTNDISEVGTKEKSIESQFITTKKYDIPIPNPDLNPQVNVLHPKSEDNNQVRSKKNKGKGSRIKRRGLTVKSFGFIPDKPKKISIPKVEAKKPVVFEGKSLQISPDGDCDQNKFELPIAINTSTTQSDTYKLKDKVGHGQNSENITEQVPNAECGKEIDLVKEDHENMDFEDINSVKDTNLETTDSTQCVDAVSENVECNRLDLGNEEVHCENEHSTIQEKPAKNTEDMESQDDISLHTDKVHEKSIDNCDNRSSTDCEIQFEQKDQKVDQENIACIKLQLQNKEANEKGITEIQKKNVLTSECGKNVMNDIENQENIGFKRINEKKEIHMESMDISHKIQTIESQIKSDQNIEKTDVLINPLLTVHSNVEDSLQANSDSIDNQPKTIFQDINKENEINIKSMDVSHKIQITESQTKSDQSIAKTNVLINPLLTTHNNAEDILQAKDKSALTDDQQKTICQDINKENKINIKSMDVSHKIQSTESQIKSDQNREKTDVTLLTTHSNLEDILQAKDECASIYSQQKKICLDINEESEINMDSMDVNQKVQTTKSQIKTNQDIEKTNVLKPDKEEPRFEGILVLSDSALQTNQETSKGVKEAIERLCVKADETSTTKLNRYIERAIEGQIVKSSTPVTDRRQSHGQHVAQEVNKEKHEGGMENFWILQDTQSTEEGYLVIDPSMLCHFVLDDTLAKTSNQSKIQDFAELGSSQNVDDDIISRTPSPKRKPHVVGEVLHDIKTQNVQSGFILNELDIKNQILSQKSIARTQRRKSAAQVIEDTFNMFLPTTSNEIQQNVHDSNLSARQQDNKPNVSDYSNRNPYIPISLENIVTQNNSVFSNNSKQDHLQTERTLISNNLNVYSTAYSSANLVHSQTVTPSTTASAKITMSNVERSYNHHIGSSSASSSNIANDSLNQNISSESTESSQDIIPMHYPQSNDVTYSTVTNISNEINEIDTKYLDMNTKQTQAYCNSGPGPLSELADCSDCFGNNENGNVQNYDLSFETKNESNKNEVVETSNNSDHNYTMDQLIGKLSDTEINLILESDDIIYNLIKLSKSNSLDMTSLEDTNNSPCADLNENSNITEDGSALGLGTFSDSTWSPWKNTSRDSIETMETNASIETLETNAKVVVMSQPSFHNFQDMLYTSLPATFLEPDLQEVTIGDIKAEPDESDLNSLLTDLLNSSQSQDISSQTVNTTEIQLNSIQQSHDEIPEKLVSHFPSQDSKKSDPSQGENNGISTGTICKDHHGQDKVDTNKNPSNNFKTL